MSLFLPSHLKLAYIYCMLQKTKKEMETRRDQLGDALYQKGLALSEMESLKVWTYFTFFLYICHIHLKFIFISINFVCYHLKNTHPKILYHLYSWEYSCELSGKWSGWNSLRCSARFIWINIQGVKEMGGCEVIQIWNYFCNSRKTFQKARISPEGMLCLIL